MKVDTLIEKFFATGDGGKEYIKNRLLENYLLAPPGVVTRHLEEYPSDKLMDIAFELKDMELESFWNNCLVLLQDWCRPEEATEERALAMVNLSFMMRLFIQHHEDTFTSKHRNIWRDVIKKYSGLDNLEIILGDPHKSDVYACTVSLIYGLEAWNKKQWSSLFNGILLTGRQGNNRHQEMLQLASDFIDWNNPDSLYDYLMWQNEAEKLCTNYIECYFLDRLLLCGTKKTQVAQDEQKRKQKKLSSDIFDVVSKFLGKDKITSDKKKMWRQCLTECLTFFRMDSFHCFKEGEEDTTLNLSLLEERINMLGKEKVRCYQKYEGGTSALKRDMPVGQQAA